MREGEGGRDANLELYDLACIIACMSCAEELESLFAHVSSIEVQLEELKKTKNKRTISKRGREERQGGRRGGREDREEGEGGEGGEEIKKRKVGTASALGYITWNREPKAREGGRGGEERRGEGGGGEEKKKKKVITSSHPPALGYIP